MPAKRRVIVAVLLLLLTAAATSAQAAGIAPWSPHSIAGKAGVAARLGAGKTHALPEGAPPREPATAPANDACSCAILISCGNINLTGNTSMATNDYSPDSTGCTHYSAPGRDVVYKISASNGDSLWVDYTSTGADGSIYLVTDCSNVTASCVAGADNTLLNETEQLRYKFTSHTTYYLILDSSDGVNSFGSWTLNGQLLCGPNSPPSNDRCETATPLLCGPINLSGSTANATNDYTFPSDLSSCFGHKADGKDVAYKLSVTAGDSIAVDYTSTANGSVYIVGDCTNPAGTCITGKDVNTTGQTESLRYTFDFSATYYLIFDSRDAGSSGTWTATGTLQCGLHVPTNDACSGAITIPCGDINLSGSTQLAHNDYLLSSNNCTGFTTDGNDVVYKLNAHAGDSLWVDYRSTTDGSIYMVTDCSQPGATCLVGADNGVEKETEHLRYKFTSNVTAYLILDSYDLNSFGDWTLVGGMICTLVGVDPERPGARLELEDVQPNPFLRSSTVSFALPASGPATLRVYDLEGRVVRTLLDRELPAGRHQVAWDGKDDGGARVGPGVYFAKLASLGRSATKRMVFVR